MSFEIGGVEVFSLEEVSKKLGVEVDALKRCIRKGDLVARKVGDSHFVTAQNLLAFLASPAQSGSKKTPKKPVDSPAAAAGPVLEPEIQAMFEMPVLPPDPKVADSLKLRPEPPQQRGPSAVVPGQATPSTRSRRTLLDSEEMPVPHVDMPGGSKPPESTPTPEKLSSVPLMFGPESPTLLLRPDTGEPRPDRRVEDLQEKYDHGRAAQKERDGLITRIRKLSLEEQSKTLAGATGDQLVKLDRLIEEGVRAQKELGLPPAPAEESLIPPPGAPVSAVPQTAEFKPPTIVPFEEIPPEPGARAEKEPPPVEATAAEALPPPIEVKPESKWIPVEERVTEPFGLISPGSEPDPGPGTPRPAPVEPPPQPLDPTGGETWQEVGLPGSAAKTPDDYQLSRATPVKVERITLSLTDEERKLLADHRIPEDTAVNEIMQKYQPTTEKSWEYAKHRFFQLLRMKTITW